MTVKAKQLIFMTYCLVSALVRVQRLRQVCKCK